MVDIIISIKHPTCEMGYQILSPLFLCFRLEKTYVEISLLFGLVQLGVFIDPALCGQDVHLFLTNAFKLLIEVDPPGGITDHLISTRFVG